MATQIMTNHHHVTFSGSSQALRHSSPGPGPTTSYSANGFMMNGGASYSNGASLTAVEHDNPFRPGSEVIEEAESILKKLTIVGSQVIVASNDSGIGASTPNHQEQSPVASRTNDLQCSTILSTTTSTPGPVAPSLKEDQCVVVRASPESLRPESPPQRAEHVVVTSHGDVKASPKKSDDKVDQAPPAPTEGPSTPDKKGKKKGKKKCSVL